MKKDTNRSTRKIVRKVNRASLFRPRPPCSLLSNGIKEVDYKDLPLLKRHVGEDWKICPGRLNNVSARMQRQIKTAVKRARLLALLPYAPCHHPRPDR